MKKIPVIDRDQLRMTSFDMMVDESSVVRVLDVFLDWSMDQKLAFKVSKQRTGRPAFPLRTLLGIYIYGYLHRIRSSRDLEKACRNNIEMMWLIRGQKPCYKTIADFRKNNRKGFRNLFKAYRDFCIRLNLYGKKVLAIDGSKFRAQNSMKNNYTEKKIDRHLDYIETKQEAYLADLDEEDRVLAKKKPEAFERLKQLADRKLKYQELKRQLKNTDETQLSTVDPDARSLPLHMRIVEVGYNLQSAVDDKHNLIVEYEVTNKNDSNALAPMAVKSKEALGLNEDKGMTVLADKGYHKAQQLKDCHDQNIKTVVAIPRKPKQTDRSKPEFLRKENFKYSKRTDSYRCPNGKILQKQGRYRRSNHTSFDRYTIKNSICKTCPYYDGCISPSNRKSSQGRYIDRYLNDDAVLKNKRTVARNKLLYKRRQAIVEHPFGTIKRGWGYTYTLMKTMPKVETEFSIILLCYNLKRTLSILGYEGLKEALNGLKLKFLDVRRVMAAVSINVFWSQPVTPQRITQLCLS